ncbi:MAG: AraC family transcriptional regulator [Bacteroidales bacterium]|nr:AraC family transcriptional regulator [Bacteroidales bacterium]
MRVCRGRDRVSVQDVAMRLGFSDQSAFGKFFKRCSGLSPCQFAKQS